MKKICGLVLTSFVGMTTFASDDFYVCSGFNGIEEYRAGINLNTKEASFFDNDSTLVLPLKDEYILPTEPIENAMTFESPKTEEGHFMRLYFNVSRKTAYMYSFETDGWVVDLGSVDCVLSTPWE